MKHPTPAPSPPTLVAVVPDEEGLKPGGKTIRGAEDRNSAIAWVLEADA